MFHENMGSYVKRWHNSILKTGLVGMELAYYLCEPELCLRLLPYHGNQRFSRAIRCTHVEMRGLTHRFVELRGSVFIKGRAHRRQQMKFKTSQVGSWMLTNCFFVFGGGEVRPGRRSSCSRISQQK